MKHKLIWIFVLSITVAAGPAWSQPAGSTERLWSNDLGCTLEPDDAPLERSLDLDLLNHLERMSRSVFVHAFLLSYVGHPEAGAHRLSKCARNFLAADVTEFGALRSNLPDATALIEALRQAERRRLETNRLAADSSLNLRSRISAIRSDFSDATLAVALNQFEQVLRSCGPRVPACTQLEEVRKSIQKLIRVRQQVDQARQDLRLATEENARLRRAEDAALRLESDPQEETDQGLSPAPAPNPAAPPTAADSSGVVSDSTTLPASDKVTVAAPGPDEEALRQRLDSLTFVVQNLERELGTEIDSLAKMLSPGSDLGAQQVRPTTSATAATPTSAISVPPLTGAEDPRTQSANLMMGLTDFIIDRARRELVNGFVVSLYPGIREDTLLQSIFPDTWKLMSGVAAAGVGGAQAKTLSAMDVGRIPLTSWRATLASDFVHLPVSLLTTEARLLCGPLRSRKADPAHGVEPLRLTEQDSISSHRCRARLVTLRPLAPAAQRLLEGDPILPVLADVPQFLPLTGEVLPDQWHVFAHAVSMVGDLANAFAVQGSLGSVDPHQHPYILTTRSLSHTSNRQRDLLLRLLLVRAIRTESLRPATVDTAALRRSVNTATRLLERISTRGEVAGRQKTDLAFVIRTGFESLSEASNLARALVPDQQVAWIDTVGMRWRALGETVEPLIGGDFGLAFARSTVLLQDLRGARLPAPIITFSALASSLSEANDGDQVRRAFEAAASPVGGWQGKRQGESRLSISAFPGALGGREFLIKRSADPSGIEEGAWSAALSLPLGIEYQSGWPNRCPVFCSVGIFVPVVDLGALLSYRFDGSDEVRAEPNASLQQVFAPGVFLNLPAFRNFPLNLMGGVQLMPALRRIDTGTGQEDRTAYRFVAGAGIDVMLFGF